MSKELEAELKQAKEDYRLALGAVVDLSRSIAHLTKALGEAHFQVSWWEDNYGHGVVLAPSQKQNEQFIEALDKVEDASSDYECQCKEQYRPDAFGNCPECGGKVP